LILENSWILKTQFGKQEIKEFVRHPSYRDHLRIAEGYLLHFLGNKATACYEPIETNWKFEGI
jgi:hypothetical protein